MTFLLFTGYNYYPIGGFDDFAGVYATLDEAKIAANDRSGDWAHIVEWYNGAVVLRSDASERVENAWQWSST